MAHQENHSTTRYRCANSAPEHNITSNEGPHNLYSTFDDMDFNSNLDWILKDVSGEDLLSPADLFGFQGCSDGLFSQTLPVSAVPAPVLSTRYTDAGDHDREDLSGHDPDSTTALGGLLTPQPQEMGDPGDPWPLDTPRPTQSHMALPALGGEGHDFHAFARFFSVMPVSDRTWHALRKCLMLPFEHNSIQSLNLDQFPSKEKLDHCIDLYFAYFHPTLDLVHQPTFDPGRDLVLTLAMVSIGACYSDLPGAKVFSIVLSELIRRLLIFMAEQDRRFVRTGPYLTAQLLQGTHGYCTGSERLFELSESSRSTLLHQARCMGLFRFEAPAPTQEDLTLEDMWRQWIEAEKLRRLGWVLYMYDASVAYLLNNRPFLSIGDINLNLPASAEEWAAETAQAWAALHPPRTYPTNLPLRPTIRILFDGTPNAAEKITDEGHRFLVVLTLVRMLCSLKENRSSPLNDLIMPAPFDDGRTDLLRALDAMSVSIVVLSKSHTKTEVDRLVHRMRLIHVAHIYGAGDLMNWLYPYLRHGLEAENAAVRMRRWGSEDSQRTREVAYHSAQILGLIRNYPNSMPLEPYLIFHAGVVLSCVALLLPPSTPSNQSPQLQIDQLDPGDNSIAKRHLHWVKSGGPQCISISGVQSLCAPTGRQEVLDQTAALLKRQKVWGIARNLEKVILALRGREQDTVL
ncbi:Fungal specific transcription factor domain-containing protein [Cladophialophora immunda]|nr:Fungal specific transcription factor domain-containing protein [Cladophialophora immunda]